MLLKLDINYGLYAIAFYKCNLKFCFRVWSFDLVKDFLAFAEYIQSA